MGTQNAKDFIGQLGRDQNLAEKADDAYVAALHGVATGAGFDFSESDLRVVLDGGAGDLTEDELDGVVGGTFGSGLVANTASGGFVANTADGGSVFNTASAGANSLTVTVWPSFSQKGFRR